mgnify:FL=1
MKTLDLFGASTVLKLHPNTVRCKARNGEIPASKQGRRWIFIEDDLVKMIRSDYSSKWQVSHKQENTLCGSTKEMTSTTQTTRSTDEEYENLLRLPAEVKPKSF